MPRLFALLLCCLLCRMPLAVAEEVLVADYRPRPPEMFEVDGQPGGPLVSILEAAARRAGASIQWRKTPFIRSLEDLKSGRVDLVPRVLFSRERVAFVHYLPPIGSQRKTILFIVRPGRETELTRYTDLHRGVTGAKRGTVYFEEFDRDQAIRKSLMVDDAILARMFQARRLERLIVLDKEAIEAEFRNLGFDDYTYADYRHEQSIDNHYGASRRLYEGPKKALYDRLGVALSDMRSSGEVQLIYNRHGVPSPDAPLD
jgi:polar amino acid transport system substrate-binding protein